MTTKLEFALAHIATAKEIANKLCEALASEESGVYNHPSPTHMLQATLLGTLRAACLMAEESISGYLSEMTVLETVPVGQE